VGDRVKESTRWLLPEGIEESLPPEAARIETLRRTLLDLYRSWGYELVIPPLIEYLDSLLIGVGNELDLQTFKITDQLNGRLMGVRADITPQVARIDAHRLKREAPTRLCYLARVLRTRPQGPGGTRSPLQVGAELYGHSGVDSDIEVIRLMLATLESCDIKNVHLDLGHQAIFQQLSAISGLITEGENALFDMLQRKAIPEIEQFIDKLGLPEEQSRWFLALPELNGDVDILEQARAMFANAGEAVLQAIDYLATVGESIRSCCPAVEVRFDLAELRGYEYHTGIVYAAYVPGRGAEIARGGRYDGIGAAFGRASPATGFSTDLESLVRLSGKTAEVQPPAIFAPARNDPALEEIISRLRSQGRIVIRELHGQSADPRRLGCGEILSCIQGRWIVEKLES